MRMILGLAVALWATAAVGQPLPVTAPAPAVGEVDWAGRAMVAAGLVVGAVVVADLVTGAPVPVPLGLGVRDAGGRAGAAAAGGATLGTAFRDLGAGLGRQFAQFGARVRPHLHRLRDYLRAQFRR